MDLTQLRDELHATAVDKGWHSTDRSFGDYIALMHSELSEALEEYRKGKDYNDVYFTKPTVDNLLADENSEESYRGAKPEGIPVELADVIIRILDFCGRYNIDIEKVLLDKAEYNTGRSFRHGGKVV